MNSPGNDQLSDSQVLSSISEVLSWEAACISKVRERLDDSYLRAVRLILGCRGKLIVSGLGKMGAIAHKAAATFCSTGTPAVFLHPSEALHGDLGVAINGDVLIALSNSGQTEEVAALIPYMARQGIPIVALTGRIQSSLARQAEIVLDTSVEREADPITSAPTASSTVALAICDALAIAVARSRGLTAEQFALFHPGGFLGKRLLLTVREIMHSGERIPLVSPTASLREAILIISQKALGCVFVVGNNKCLEGILTDGDLRRSLAANKNPLEDKVVQHMSHNPRSISADTRAVSAIQLMEECSITVLPVVDAEKAPIGVIHLHDLVKAGLG